LLLAVPKYFAGSPVYEQIKPNTTQVSSGRRNAPHEPYLNSNFEQPRHTYANDAITRH